jgi:hypothetical protein
MLRRDGYRVANDSLAGLLAAASSQAGPATPPGPDETRGDPADSGHPVNGNGTAFISRLPGHEPGPGPDGLPGEQR